MNRILYNPTIQSSIGVDLYHGDVVTDSSNGGINSFSLAAQSGIALFILKATQGTGVVDPLFLARRTACEALGVRRGAYHYLSTRNGVAEANFFLSTIGSDFSSLGVALDLEAPTTTISAARDWVNVVESAIGRQVLIYTGAYFVGADGVGFPDTVLNQHPLWVPEYGSSPYCPLGWTSWALHQWTDGTILPSRVPGLGAVDQSRYPGTPEDFTNWWDSFVSSPVVSSPVTPPTPPPASSPTTATPNLPANMVITIGMTNTYVGLLQRALNSYGAEPQLTVDNNFGPGTKYAVEQYQLENGLAVDGIVGPKTQRALGLIN
jgi:lysozyme